VSIKSILCVYNGETSELNALSLSLSLAVTGHASLRVLHVANNALPLGEGFGIVGYGISAYGDGAVMEVLERGAREETEIARTRTVSYVESHGLKVSEDAETWPLGQCHVTFRTVTGEISTVIPREGRTVDLVVVPYLSGAGGDLATLLSALYATGRPVLAMPSTAKVPASKTGFASKVCIAWDGSLSASRAVREAVPHLLHAQDVYLVRIQQAREAQDAVSEADIKAYLRSHCIEATSLHIAAGHHLPGEALLQKAGTLDAELLVMGAYGNTHIGEFLFGGTTDYVVKHAHLPLLLTH